MVTNRACSDVLPARLSVSLKAFSLPTFGKCMLRNSCRYTGAESANTLIILTEGIEPPSTTRLLYNNIALVSFEVKDDHRQVVELCLCQRTAF